MRPPLLEAVWIKIAVLRFGFVLPQNSSNSLNKVACRFQETLMFLKLAAATCGPSHLWNTYIYIYTYTHNYIYIMCVYVCLYIYIYTYTVTYCIYSYIYIYIQLQLHTYIYIYDMNAFSVESRTPTI